MTKEKERFMICERELDKEFWMIDKIWWGMLEGPDDLLRLMEDRQSQTSKGSVGERNSELVNGSLRQSEKWWASGGIVFLTSEIDMK